MRVTIEKQQDGTYIAYNKGGQNSYIGTGSTLLEARDDFFNTMREAREALAEAGLPVPSELTGEVEFKFDVASLFEYFPMLNVSAFARSIGINDGLMRQYRRGGTYISDAQLSRIEQGVHALGKQLSSLRLV